MQSLWTLDANQAIFAPCLASATCTVRSTSRVRIRDAQEMLDLAVLAAYGWPKLSPGDLGGTL